MSIWAQSKYEISKRKTKPYEKAKNHIFRSVGFADLFLEFKDIQNSRQNRSKNKLVRENAVTRAHGSCSLQVMGSWLYQSVQLW